ncbi:MAG: ABC transporter permease [Clostridia bacterium]|nr:ABC transporter permease [Clostridia bacterium]
MKTAQRVYTALIFILIYAPLAVMILFSFNSTSSTSVFAGLSFKWYRELFSNSDTLEALKNTLLLAFVSSIAATLLGTVTAVGIYRMRSRVTREIIKSVTNIPMMNPDIVTGVSLMLLFVFVGRLLGRTNTLSFWTLLISHITFNLPYVILNVLPKLRQTDRHLHEAALDLGCSPVEAFMKVTLPAIRSGIVSGLLMAFTLSLDDFIISYYTVGADFQTLPLKIYAMTKKTVKPDMYALSSVIFFTILILLMLINMAGMRSDNNSNGSKKSKKKV